MLRERRGQGVGRALMEAIIAGAREDFAMLRLRTRNPAAAALYESFGFVRSISDDETHRLSLR